MVSQKPFPWESSSTEATSISTSTAIASLATASELSWPMRHPHISIDRGGSIGGDIGLIIGAAKDVSVSHVNAGTMKMPTSRSTVPVTSRSPTAAGS
jgi:hypothetical protein